MGLLTILKKMKQKEKEVRLLMLYPLSLSLERPTCFPRIIHMYTVTLHSVVHECGLAHKDDPLLVCAGRHAPTYRTIRSND